MYAHPVSDAPNDSFGYAFVAAVAFHALLILGVSFDISRETPPVPERTLDITLVQPKAEPKKPVENPDFLAQQIPNRIISVEGGIRKVMAAGYDLVPAQCPTC